MRGGGGRSKGESGCWGFSCPSPAGRGAGTFQFLVGGRDGTEPGRDWVTNTTSRHPQPPTAKRESDSGRGVPHRPLHDNLVQRVLHDPLSARLLEARNNPPYNRFVDDGVDGQPLLVAQ